MLVLFAGLVMVILGGTLSNKLGHDTNMKIIKLESANQLNFFIIFFPLSTFVTRATSSHTELIHTGLDGRNGNAKIRGGSCTAAVNCFDNVSDSLTALFGVIADVICAARR
jgi:hypothetical protein